MVGTFKIITMASAVEEKVIDIFNEHFYDTGKVNVDGSVLKCWKSGGHGDQTYLQILQNSCNPGFVKLGQLLGKDKLFSYIIGNALQKREKLHMQNRQIFSCDFKLMKLQYIVANERKNTIFCSPKKSLKKLKKNLKNIEKMLDLKVCL